MTSTATLTRMTAQHLFDHHYSDDRPLYLLVNDELCAIDNIQHATIGTTYIGGGYDVLLESEQDYRYIDKYDDVYLDEHYAPINDLDAELTATDQCLIDALLDDAPEWTVTTETHALPPDVANRIPSDIRMWQPGDPIPNLRIGNTRVELNDETHGEINQ